MSTSLDLMGLGMPAPLAARLGYDATSINGAGTSSTTATTMTSKNVSVFGAASQTGAIIPAAMSIGGFMFIACRTTSTASAVIYPPSGATITNATSVTLAADKNMIVWRFSSTVFYHVILA